MFYVYIYTSTWLAEFLTLIIVWLQDIQSDTVVVIVHSSISLTIRETSSKQVKSVINKTKGKKKGNNDTFRSNSPVQNDISWLYHTDSVHWLDSNRHNPLPFPLRIYLDLTDRDNLSADWHILKYRGTDNSDIVLYTFRNSQPAENSTWFIMLFVPLCLSAFLLLLVMMLGTK